MKKMICGFLAVMLLCLTACNGATPDSSNSSLTGSGALQTEPKSEVGNLKASSDGRTVKQVLIKFLGRMGYSVVPMGDSKATKTMALRANLIEEGEFADFDKVCTKAEAALIALRSTREWENYRRWYRETQKDIKDFDTIPARYQDAVLRLYSRNCIALDDANHFNPLAGAEKDFVDDLCEKAINPNLREPSNVANISYGKVLADFQRCDNASNWARHTGDVKLSTTSAQKAEGAAALKLDMKFTSASYYMVGVTADFDKTADLSDYAGVEISFYNPDSVSKRLQLYIQNSNGKKLLVHNERAPQGQIYGLGSECMLDKTEGWQTVRFLFDSLEIPGGNWAVMSMSEKDEVTRFLKEIDSFSLDVVTDDANGASVESSLYMDNISFFKGELRNRSSALYGDVTKEDPSYDVYQSGLSDAEGKTGLAAAQAYVRLMETTSPCDTAVRKKLTTLYQTLSEDDRTAIKELLVSLYDKYLYEDREKAQGLSAVHASLTDIWSANPGAYSQVLSTQAIGNFDGFVPEPKLTGTLEKFTELGVDTVKLSLARWDVEAAGPNDVIAMAKEPTWKAVFSAPSIQNYILWVHEKGSDWPSKGYEDGFNAKVTYDQIYGLTKHLLETYNKTGKSFYLGHWEGDWVYQSVAFEFPGAAKTNGLIEWFKTRNEAINAALDDTPHENVYVYSYIEVNSPAAAALGTHNMSTCVLPYSTVDFVSISGYMLTDYSLAIRGDTDKAITIGMNGHQANLPPKDIPGKRVFFGEFGENINGRHEKTIKTAVKAIAKWGSPFAMIWEMWGKEGSIDNWGIYYGNKTGPIYPFIRESNAMLKKYIADYQQKNGKKPSQREICDKLEDSIHIS